VAKSIGKIIGENVRQAREQLGWPKGYLAERCGLSHSYIGRLERGAFDSPGLDAVETIASALGMTVPQLMTGIPSGLTSEERVMLSLFRTLTSEHKEVVLTVTRALSYMPLAVRMKAREQERERK